MDGDSPRQAQRQLTERTLNLRFNDASLRIQLILGVLPLQRLDLYPLGITSTKHTDTTLVDFHDFSDTTVKVTVFSRGVVFHKHHLCTLLQRQHLTRRIGVFRKIAFNLGLECIAVTWQFLQFVLVVVIRQIVMGGQTDIAFALLRDKSRLASLIQSSDVVGGGICLTDVVQNIEESGIFLTKHLTQQDGDIFYLLQGLRSKEIGRVVIGF